MKIAIIGGGASGLWAANQIKRHVPDALITIYEKTDKTGRKILSSGNGRGNLSNTHVCPSFYNCPDFVAPILQQFSASDFLQACRELGILTKVDEMGRIYPHGDSALIFLEALKMSNIAFEVHERLLTPVEEIERIDGQYRIHHEMYDIVLIAIGSQAGVPLKYQSNHHLQWLTTFGHHIKAMKPTLSAIGVSETLKLINGQRVEVKARLIIDDVIILERFGEVLFREKALSGIVIFELSSHLTWYQSQKSIKQAIIQLDLLPDMTETQLLDHFNEQPDYLKQSGLEQRLMGIFHPHLCNYLAYKVNSVRELVVKIKQLDFHVDLSFIPDNQQVMHGGVVLDEVNPNTLESKLNPNLYFIGEALDVDGECGGFNLHFAWASATYVAHAIAKKSHF